LEAAEAAPATVNRKNKSVQAGNLMPQGYARIAFDGKVE